MARTITTLFFHFLPFLSPLVVVAVPSNTSSILTPCSSDHISRAIRASCHCKPIMKVVKLDLPGNGSFTQMTPQFVSAYQCGGGCHTPSHSCVSTTRVSRLIPVLLSQCGMSAGQCAKSCATVTIEEDSACQCACLQQQRICANARHSFNSHSCSCECQVEEEYTLCRDQGRVWDNKECVCRCPVEMVKPCSTGYTFDYSSTCSCIPEDTNDIIKIVTDERVERSDTLTAEDNKYIEMVIIAALAGIATVFFIIIVSLLHSVKALKRTINIMRVLIVKDRKDLSGEQSLLTKHKL
eukprot:GFUD01025117.1.p1 GENE.GFUD01025117.1~~GFUD01025117.1.p1  ORF type:complete len:295 (+),score=80.04 GFUD01025117.1:173-1057(+)